MSCITVLLIDGPGDGQIFAIQDELHTVELFSSDGVSRCRYQNIRFILDGKTYLVGALDKQNADGYDVPMKIRAAKLGPLPDEA